MRETEKNQSLQKNSYTFTVHSKNTQHLEFGHWFYLGNCLLALAIFYYVFSFCFVCYRCDWVQYSPSLNSLNISENDLKYSTTTEGLATTNNFQRKLTLAKDTNALTTWTQILVDVGGLFQLLMFLLLPRFCFFKWNRTQVSRVVEQNWAKWVCRASVNDMKWASSHIDGNLQWIVRIQWINSNRESIILTINFSFQDFLQLFTLTISYLSKIVFFFALSSMSSWVLILHVHISTMASLTSPPSSSPLKPLS